ncbi:hypothetical protein L228DRAFT_238238 [Xylona heveae TC161]|uniref:Bromodomain associated domain-containing protein n=1 Tax=Xylona heveae (strain CBS 132557 / TC161) TaxID=1328760 RepID=A0A165HLU0_XYLHT|nr:hypothetical protein L228DRAFT_238238 [Xylona heveae TC161]KZF23709.1 hypothetical protein L228DRAFT_238238 [Xylona heveae TC161]
MSSQALHIALLRPPILHILRAAGFHTTRPSVLDTVVDLAARYLILLSSTTASHAFNNHNDFAPDITDVRMAMQDLGLFQPEMGVVDEEWHGDEDLRGIDAFLEWAKGDVNREIRRIAGLVGETGQPDMDSLEEREDYLTALKKKHSKTGEESRYQGTALGKFADDRPIKIEGGQAETIQAWQDLARERARTEAAASLKSRSKSNKSGNSADSQMDVDESSLSSPGGMLTSRSESISASNGATAKTAQHSDDDTMQE